MKSKKDGVGYNERLFSSGFRKRLHLSRFIWIKDYLFKQRIVPKKVIELGCFDGKIINFLPKDLEEYIGFDANWEGGLDIAREKFKHSSFAKFHESQSPEDMKILNNKKFDVGFCMETLEHVPPELVEPYLITLKNHIDGYLFITVPNEKGILFLIKYIYKVLFSKDYPIFSFSEIIYSTIGLTSKVKRDEHKGFDYDQLAKIIGKYFDIIEFSGHPFSLIPKSLCFGIGIVCKSK